ncbi:SH3 domain-containing protein [Mucisphaera calidilacus]|uniref:Bacterial SH3 domain protein n=1 Tax=Mucisphaera calidilacus TaxID=2527982 RepID=A0A518C0J2_9BACT|nr:SH3 domain-containing protein [Mucisphaera calidilacus]QDU72729.1 Bacterial SH3 domain protein [Mucisphaera calidilacus]
MPTMTTKHTRFTLLTLVITLAALLPGPTAAQDTPPDLPFLALVINEQAELRAGPGKAYYTVGRINRNDVVEVHDAMLGWYKIAAPEGVYSYISVMHVKASGDGTIGVVDDDRATVKAASEKGPGWSFKSQATLTRGTEVTIVGEEGSFYRIVPPDDARVFVERAALRPISDAELEALRQADEQPVPVITQPEPQPQPQQQPQPEQQQAQRGPLIPPPAPATDNEQPEQTPAEPAPVSEPQAVEQSMPVEPATEEESAWPAIGKDTVSVATEPQSNTLEAVEQRNRPNFGLPLEEMPIDQMQADYETLRDDDSLTAQDQQIVEIRLIAIDRNRQLRDRLRAEQEAQTAQTPQIVVEETPAEDAVPVVDRSENAAPIEDYAFVGRLVQSSLYDGQQGRPSLLRLVDPTTRRTLGYIVTRSISDRRAISSLVGILGERTRDEDLGIMIIEPTQIDLLSVRP